jgi:hypothetical protein
MVSEVRVASAWSSRVEASWAAKGRWVERPADVGLVVSVAWGPGRDRAVEETVVLAERQSGVAVGWAVAVVSVQHVTVERTLVERRRGVGYAVL